MKNTMISKVVELVREIKRDKYGVKYCDINSVHGVFHWSKKNSKVGKAIGVNFPIFYTCRHDCECYTKKVCYAQCGCYMFNSNQQIYAENYKFYMENPIAWWKTLQNTVNTEAKNYELLRFFECGDFPRMAFVSELVDFANDNPELKIWLYTKKYFFVNRYCDNNGVNSIPENVHIIFSHWLNEDGTYLPMDNPYNFPTSEFIPMGREDLLENVTHICPCSDPNVIATCETCEHPCYELKHGESMALLEHSTPKTRARDKAVHAAKTALEKALKAIA